MTRTNDAKPARGWRLQVGLACALVAGCSAGAPTTQTAATTDTTAAATTTSDDVGEPPAPSGPKAPAFSLPTLDGRHISLSDYEGDKVVLVDFWSTTCDPCLREMPELIKLYKERKDKGFEILAVSVDPPETMAQVKPTVRKIGMIFPVLLDEETEVMDRYNPKGEMPFTVVVDKTGSIVLKRSGYQPGDETSWNALVSAIDQAMAR